MEDDLEIWRYQKYVEHPALSRVDAKPYMALRKWATQFYDTSPTSPPNDTSPTSPPNDTSPTSPPNDTSPTNSPNDTSPDGGTATAAPSSVSSSA